MSVPGHRLLPINPLYISIFNGLATVGGAYISTRLLEELTQKSKSPVFYWFFTIVYIGILAGPSLGLMETPLAMLLLGAGLYLLYKGNPACYLLLGVAAFTRLELVVFLIGALAYSVILKRSNIKASLVYLLSGTIPFIAYDLYFWGALIPNTMKAKQLIYGNTPLGSFAEIVLSFFPDFPIFSIGKSPGMLATYAVWAVLGAVFLLLVTRSGQKGEWKTSSPGFSNLILLCSLAIMAAYVLESVTVFSWYVPLYAVPFILSLFVVFTKFEAIYTRWIFAPVIAFWIAGPLIYASSLAITVFLNKSAALSKFENGARVRTYLEIGNALRQQYPYARLLTSEIGGLGYSFGGYILDGAGLVSPQALKFQPMKVPEEKPFNRIGAIPEGFVELTNPEIIASYDVFVTSFMHSDYKKNYVWITLPAYAGQDLDFAPDRQPWYGGHFNLFIRKDVYQAHPYEGAVAGIQ